MTTAAEALAARWRRLDTAVGGVRTAVEFGFQHLCPDAVDTTLDALYDLWELWTHRTDLNLKGANSRVRYQSDGELVAALVHARGAKSHAAVEFGNLTGTYGDKYPSIYGCWGWQPHSDPKPRFEERDTWYATHIAHQEVLPVLETAVSWFRLQPELQ